GDPAYSLKDCDTYCPMRLSGTPGPKYKTNTSSMCAMKGYGTIDGVLAPTKPPVVMNPDMDPRVIEPCVKECSGSNSDPTSDAYQSCFADCKVKKAAELNAPR